MKLTELVNRLELKVFAGESLLDREVNGGYSSDLLSDVMGYSSEGELWITLQSHMNIVAIASLKDLAAIILVKNIEADNQVIEKAKEEEVVILGTQLSTFEINGKIFSLLNE